MDFEALVKRSLEIYVKPKITYTYDDILLGVEVEKPSGQIEKMYAIDSDTWRAFHHIDNPSGIFKDYLYKNKKVILDKLRTVSSENEIDSFENKLIKEIKTELEKHTLNGFKPDTLNSYNRMRQPIDLFIEHIVTMSTELEGLRGSAVKFMFLPLGKQIFSNRFLFSEQELKKLSLSGNSTFGELVYQSDYRKIQDRLSIIAKRISQETGKVFHRVFFDLLWKDRYKSPGANLFQLNPDQDK